MLCSSFGQEGGFDVWRPEITLENKILWNKLFVVLGCVTLFCWKWLRKTIFTLRWRGTSGGPETDDTKMGDLTVQQHVALKILFALKITTTIGFSTALRNPPYDRSWYFFSPLWRDEASELQTIGNFLHLSCIQPEKIYWWFEVSDPHTVKELDGSDEKVMLALQFW